MPSIHTKKERQRNDTGPKKGQRLDFHETDFDEQKQPLGSTIRTKIQSIVLEGCAYHNLCQDKLKVAARLHFAAA